MKTLDINCDLGESFGHYIIGNDQAVFPHITSCNIACGFHGGDPLHMHRTIESAIKHRVQIGAHPGFPDRPGFGRRKMELPPEEIKATIKYQLAAISGMAKSLGADVTYMKPHGALYNMAVVSESISNTLIDAVLEVDPNMRIMGLAGSLFQELCESRNVRFISEGFADRSYLPDGSLQPRISEEAVVFDPGKAAEQVLEMVQRKRVRTIGGTTIPLEIQSICVHGDNPAVVDILKSIDEALANTGIVKRHF